VAGPIEMQSNVNLHLKQVAVLLFTKDFDQYKLVESNIHLSKSNTRTAKKISQFIAGSTDKSLTIKN
jgi:polygalacturonase